MEKRSSPRLVFFFSSKSGGMIRAGMRCCYWCHPLCLEYGWSGEQWWRLWAGWQSAALIWRQLGNQFPFESDHALYPLVVLLGDGCGLRPYWECHRLSVEEDSGPLFVTLGCMCLGSCSMSRFLFTPLLLMLVTLPVIPGIISTSL